MSIPLDIKIEYCKRLMDEELDSYWFCNKCEEVHIKQLNPGDIFQFPLYGSLFYYVKDVKRYVDPYKPDKYYVQVILHTESNTFRTLKYEDYTNRFHLVDFEYLNLHPCVIVYSDYTMGRIVMRATNNFLTDVCTYDGRFD
jgi:hypothetical protein